MIFFWMGGGHFFYQLKLNPEIYSISVLTVGLSESISLPVSKWVYSQADLAKKILPDLNVVN